MSSSSKAVREAKARVAELEAQREVLKVEIALAESKRKPAVAALERIKARLMRTNIVSNTGGNLWIGPLAMLNVEPYGLRALGKDHKGRKLADEIAAALTSGGLKVTAGSGVSLTLKGLAGRIRRPDKAKIAAYQRAKKARMLADQKARAAANRQTEAMRAVFESGAKIPTDEIAAQLVETALAFLRVEAQPAAHELRQQLQSFDAWEGAPLRVAVDHLKFAKSGADGPCPCSNCARDRQKAIQTRDENARLDALPTVLSECHDKTHGRHRIAIERAELRLTDDWRAKLEDISPGIAALLPAKPERSWIDASLDTPRGICRKGKDPVGFVRVATLRAELEKAAKIAARKAKPGKVLHWTCPFSECGEDNVFEPNGVGMVSCATCETDFDADVVKTYKPEAKAA